jgi:hypothetical protein
MVYATNWVRMNSSRTLADLDMAFRPVDETLADTLRWLREAGHITDRQLGRLGGD